MALFPGGLMSMTAEESETFERAWKIVEECGEEERHFNQLQGIYRGLASTWILATLGAVGYLFLNKGTLTDIAGLSPFLVASMVCLLGAVGVSLISIVDLTIYHKLLLDVFNRGFELEEHFKWLPQYRHSMAREKYSVTGKSIVYYTCTVCVPLSISCFFMYKFFEQANIPMQYMVIVITAAIIAPILLVYLLLEGCKSQLNLGSHAEEGLHSIENIAKGVNPAKRPGHETGLHISGTTDEFVFFSDSDKDGVLHSSRVTANDVDFEWSASVGDFVTKTDHTLKLGPAVEKLLQVGHI